MTLTNDPVKKPLVPSVTGYPMIDTAIGYAAAHVGVLLAGICLTWMNAHGFDTKALAASGVDMPVLIAGTVSGFIISGAAWVWGQYRTKWSQQAIVNTTVTAVLTQQVPAAVMAKATPAQAQAIEDAPHATVGA